MIERGADGETKNKLKVPAIAYVNSAFPKLGAKLFDRYVKVDEWTNTKTIDLGSVEDLFGVRKVDKKYESSIYKTFAAFGQSPQCLSHPVFVAMTDRMWYGFGKKIFIPLVVMMELYVLLMNVLYLLSVETWTDEQEDTAHILLLVIIILAPIFLFVQTVIHIIVTIKTEWFERCAKKSTNQIHDFEKGAFNHKTVYQKESLRERKNAKLELIESTYSKKPLLLTLILNFLLLVCLVVKLYRYMYVSNAHIVEIHPYSVLDVYVDSVTGIVLIIIWMRFFLMFRVSKSYGRFVVYIIETLDDMKKVGFVFLAVLIPSASVFHRTIYIHHGEIDGVRSNTTSSWLDTTVKLLRMAFVDYDYDAGKDASVASGQYLGKQWWNLCIGLWILVSSVVMINLLIALMSDRFATLAERADVICTNNRAMFISTCEIVLGPWLVAKTMGKPRDERIVLPMEEESEEMKEIKGLREEVMELKGIRYEMEELTRLVREYKPPSGPSRPPSSSGGPSDYSPRPPWPPGPPGPPGPPIYQEARDQEPSLFSSSLSRLQQNFRN